MMVLLLASSKGKERGVDFPKFVGFVSTKSSDEDQPFWHRIAFPFADWDEGASLRTLKSEVVLWLVTALNALCKSFSSV
jgi:hypothetical protein